MAMATGALSTRIENEASLSTRLKSFFSRYFYFCMSLVMATLVVSGFSRTVNAGLFHASPPRPLLLWMHGAAFSSWVVFFILQSALVRVRKVSVHRFLGWFGAGLASIMVVLGVAIALVMARFNTVVFHQKDAAAFLSIPFLDMIAFGSCIALAIYWKRTPDFHRRLVFIATCLLMDAAMARFDFIFDYNLFFPGVDLLIILGMLRDWMVDGRVHKVYIYTLPPLAIAQGVAIYMWRIDPAWWHAISHPLLG